LAYAIRVSGEDDGTSGARGNRNDGCINMMSGTECVPREQIANRSGQCSIRTDHGDRFAVPCKEGINWLVKMTPAVLLCQNSSGNEHGSVSFKSDRQVSLRLVV
jgi:hypothetical protein